MKFTALAATLVALTVGFAAPASATLLICQISGHSAAKGWISDVIAIDYEEGVEEIKVVDGLTQHFLGEPAIGRVDVDNAKRTTFVWELAVTNSRRQNAKFQYRLSVQKKSGSVNLTANDLGYIGPFTGRGKCEDVKKKS